MIGSCRHRSRRASGHEARGQAALLVSASAAGAAEIVGLRRGDLAHPGADTAVLKEGQVMIGSARDFHRRSALGMKPRQNGFLRVVTIVVPRLHHSRGTAGCEIARIDAAHIREPFPHEAVRRDGDEATIPGGDRGDRSRWRAILRRLAHDIPLLHHAARIADEEA